MSVQNKVLFGEMRRGTIQGRAAWAGLLFVAPWIFGAVLFFVYPLYRSLMMSISEIVTLKPFQLRFVGLYWYNDALFKDINFLPRLLKTSVENLINLPLINVFSLIVALLLNRKSKGRGIFRMMFFLPVLLGTGFIMQQLLGQDVSGEAAGMARGMLIPTGLQAYLGPGIVSGIQSFLDRLTVVMWNSGVQIIIYLSALQSVPPSIYEAARVDSAGAWENFWLITLPLLAPMIQLNLVFTVIATFSMADNEVLEFIQRLAFETAEAHAYEFSCAVGWIYTVFVMLIVGLLFLMTRRFVNNVKEARS